MSSGFDDNVLKTKMNCEFNTMSFVRQKTRVPVPQVHALETKSDCSIGASFMLIDCFNIKLSVKILCFYNNLKKTKSLILV